MTEMAPEPEPDISEDKLTRLLGDSLLGDPENCAYCGKPAQGWAYIDTNRYCHGDWQDPSCYERASWEAYGGSRAALQAPFERRD